MHYPTPFAYFANGTGAHAACPPGCWPLARLPACLHDCHPTIDARLLSEPRTPKQPCTIISR